MATQYNLPGPQIEPEAGHWTFDGFRVRVVDIHNEHPTGNVVPPFNDDPAFLEREIEELIFLANNRMGPADIGGTFTDSDGQVRLRRPLSEFFNLRPPPITAQLDVRPPAVPPQNGGIEQPPIDDVFEQCRLDRAGPMVRDGQELARLFEDETPGLMHRHALNCLLFGRSVSPPRQARIWMALDVTIYSALLAAWHVKWGHRRQGQPDFTRSYVQRPIEYELARGAPRFQVLYDNKLNPNGTEHGPRQCPDPTFPSPGTPRHPAYPSGHSTYSAAASRILEYFFGKPGSLEKSDQQIEDDGDDHAAIHLRRLADNIGLARLWAGVHWRQDHTTGQSLGRWVADQVCSQLCLDKVTPLPEFRQPPEPRPDRCDASLMVPPFGTVEQFKNYRRNGQPCEPNHDKIPEPPPGVTIQQLQGQRGAI
jgi:hypothetical protein